MDSEGYRADAGQKVQRESAIREHGPYGPAKQCHGPEHQGGGREGV